MLYPLTKTFLYKLTPPTAPFKELVWLLPLKFNIELKQSNKNEKKTKLFTSV